MNQYAFCIKFTELYFCSEFLSCQSKKWRHLLTGLEHLSNIPFGLTLSQTYTTKTFNDSCSYCVVTLRVNPDIFTTKYWLSVYSCCCDWSPLAFWNAAVERRTLLPLSPHHVAVCVVTVWVCDHWFSVKILEIMQFYLVVQATRSGAWWDAVSFLPVSIFKIIKLLL